MKEDNKNKYRYTMRLPIELEEISRKKAMNLGFVKGGTGVMSAYIQLLIHNDLKNRPPFDSRGVGKIESGETKRINITIDEEYIELANERAKELGFIWGDGGNISGYVKYLLMKEL